ncbi:general substrate transporter [Penicillium chermesinum]|uniref:General substrate transporter n=1 Tax=Penicillium chermesinum TaxID=63820 RepID=A0A9W9TR79_9EURO|nr:general substrate transporter [Penicillium chermesinum]KAJ5238401.1 general substrate transporter [Penicillium chermesinum]
MDEEMKKEPHSEVKSEAGVGIGTKIESRHTKRVHNAELYAATRELKINPWSKESLTLHYAMFTAFACACAIGYDGSLMTGVIAIEQFQDTFHTGTTGTSVSIIYSFYTVKGDSGSMIGAPFAAIVSDKFGRLKGMFCGGIVIIIGMIIAATASTTPQFVVGRAVIGVGTAFMSVAAPTYCLEIAFPHWRGLCTGMFNMGWFGGSIPAAAVTFACSQLDSDYSWKIPVIFQALGSVIVILSVLFLPESPRYLMANGREEEAEKFLVKYHGCGRSDSSLVRLEIEEMKEGIRQDGIDKSFCDYRPFLFTHSGRWRTAQVVMMAVFGNFSGNGLGYYNTVIFANLGIASVSEQLAYNILNSAIGAIATAVALCLVDRIPRRKILVTGSFGCAVMLAINSGLSAALESQGSHIQKSYARGALAAYFLFTFVFSLTYTPLQSIVPTEALETTQRAKGWLFTIFSSVDWALSTNLPGRSLWGIWDISISISLWAGMCLNQACGISLGEHLHNRVEAQGRTLEQLEMVYKQPNPVKASLQVDKISVQDDGNIVEDNGSV